jgi:uncharacterized protein involved in outer membrane biogenesis
MKKTIRKTLRITGISLLTLIALLFLIPLFFKKEILELVRKEMNASLNAAVDFNDVDISFFRRFPRVSVRVEGLSIAGIDHFKGDTLISAKSVDAAVNLVSFFRDEKTIYAVDLYEPRILAKVDKEGRANWDIAKADSTASTDSSASGSFQLKLHHYAIHDGTIRYEDEPSGMQAALIGLDHEGSGDLGDELYTLSTRTRAQKINFTYGGIPYLSQVEAEIDSDFDIDTKNSKYGFHEGKVRINGLELNTDGFFQLVNDSTYNMDLRFNAPSTEFKDVLSLVPAMYTEDFKDLKTSGKAELKGWVKGLYATDKMPAFDLALTVVDGFFQYPSLPQAVSDIQLQFQAANPDGQPDHTVIDLKKGSLNMGGQPLHLQFTFRNPETSKWIKAVARGKVKLEQFTQFFPLAKGTQLNGDLDADLDAEGSLASIEGSNGDFRAGGHFLLSRFHYSAPDFPQPIRNGAIRAEIRNEGGVADATTIDVQQGHIEIGQDPIDFRLRLSQPVSRVVFDGSAKGRFTLDNLKQFMELEKGTAISGVLDADVQFSGTREAIDRGAYEQIRTTGTAGLTNLSYVSADYPDGVKISRGRVAVEPKAVLLNELAGSFAGTRFSATGQFDNLVGYVLKDEDLKGRMSVTADKVDLNKWMGTSTTTETAASSTGPFLVPGGVNLALDAKADEVRYDKVDYRNVQGTLLVHDETVELKNMQTDALDGKVMVNGSYSTLRSKTEPEMQFAYNVKDVDVQKAFMAFNTVQKLMPIGQFLSGKLSSQLTLNGKLDGSMLPNLSSLSGNGNMLLLEGVLKKFAPLEKIASTLNVDALKDVAVRDVKSYIDFSNGKVLVKPFTVKVKDIEMQIGGLHGFDQSLDYIVQMKIPRAYLGTNGNNLVNGLAAQASAKGIPVKLGDVVNLNIKLGGLISNPTIKTDLKEAAGDATQQMKEQATAFVKAKADSANKTLRDTISSVKKDVVNDLKTGLRDQFLGSKDSASKPVSFDSTKKKVETKVKGALNGLLKKRNGR